MAQLYAQASQQGIWMALGPPRSAAFALGQPLTLTYGDGSQDTLAAHVPAVTSAGTTQVDRTGAVWLLYVVAGEGTLRIVREMDQGTIAGSYAPLARVLADRVVPYQPDNGQAQSSSSGQSFLPLTVTNTSGTQSIGGSTTVPVATTSTDYVVQCHLSGSTATSVWNALSDKTSFTDLQVIFAGAEIDADIDQQTNGAWSSSTITLWFRLQRPIAASGVDQGYQLRVGGGLRSSPPRSWANIYPFSDDFLGSSLLGANWTTHGGPSVAVSGSLLTLGATATNQGIVAKSAFGPGYQTRLYGALVTTYDGTHICFSSLELWESANALSPPVDELSNERDLNATTSFIRQTPAVGPAGALTSTGVALDTQNHLFALARTTAGGISALVDSTASAASDATHTGAAYPTLATSTAGGASAAHIVADWIKVRPWISSEPTVVAGTLQSAGGLRWEPLVDSSGSVLVAPSGDPIMVLTSST